MNRKEVALPYKQFIADEWASLANDKFIQLSADEVYSLRSIGDPVDLKEVGRIYSPLLRYLELIILQYENSYKERQIFLRNFNYTKQPFIIGIAGSVAVGKSTMARLLQKLLANLDKQRKVDLITTDGFLYPNAELEKRQKMRRKGFPDSYDVVSLLRFLSDVKSGKDNIESPVYSHFVYDVLKDQKAIIDCPDILIVEGINVLQVYDLKQDNQSMPFVSDFFDFSIYIEADPKNIEQWYINRFMKLRESSFTQPGSYFHKYATISDDEAQEIAKTIWKDINLKNLIENIAPSKRRADLVFFKGNNHLVEKITLQRKGT